MRIAFAIDTEHDSLRIWLRSGVPAVDLCQHGFHLWIAQRVFGVPPVERAQRFIQRISRLFCFCNEPQRELMYKPPLRSRIARWIDRFLTPLKHALRLGERAFLFGVTRRRKKENLS